MASLVDTRTYQQLNGEAARLQYRGVRASDFVGLFMAKSVERYVGMLAVLKAGAAYVPLDLSFPPDRVTFILGDCGAQVLLTNRPLPAGFDACPAWCSTCVVATAADFVPGQRLTIGWPLAGWRATRCCCPSVGALGYQGRAHAGGLLGAAARQCQPLRHPTASWQSLLDKVAVNHSLL